MIRKLSFRAFLAGTAIYCFCILAAMALYAFYKG